MTKSFIIANDYVRNNCIDHIQGLDLNKWCVVIERKGKTPPQRRYWHMCLAIVAEAYGDTMERLKHMIKVNVLGYDEWVDKKGNHHKRVLSSEELDTVEYSKLIEYTAIVADHVQVQLPDPKFYGYELTKEEQKL
jgi:hypothetical protein